MASQILRTRFPEVELSYGKTLHKKVRADAYQILPRGKKCMLWFTYMKAQNVAFLLSFDKTGRNINGIKTIEMAFGDDLCLGEGTLLSGVILSVGRQSVFCCTDIHYYQGFRVERNNFEVKCDHIADMLKNHTNQTAVNELNLTILTTSVICGSFNDAISIARTLPYEVYGLSALRFNRYSPLGVIQYTQQSDPIGYFKVKAQIKCDIYNLFVSDAPRPHGIAAITDYKQSVTMNSLFRNIKENRNLDLLEMSDDEDEFEDISEDKYVDLKKTYYMKCVYVPRFRKWKPIEVCDGKTRLSSKSEIIALEKKSQDSLYGKHNSSRRRTFRKS